MENYVITVSREYGSDGCAIAERLAKELNIRYLDEELLSIVSEESGVSEELLIQADEKVKRKLWEGTGDRKYDLDYDRYDPRNPVSEHNLFRYQANTIRRLADQESFVIVGRAADYVLQHHRYKFSVNIRAPFGELVQGIMERKFVDEKTAIKDVRAINKERTQFYKTYTGKDWTDPLNYDLTINSSSFSQTACVALIRKAASLKFGFEL